MGKAAAVLTVMFMLGGGVMGLLGNVLGVYAEAASLGLVGMGLFAGSQALGGKLSDEPTTHTPAPQG